MTIFFYYFISIFHFRRGFVTFTAIGPLVLTTNLIMRPARIVILLQEIKIGVDTITKNIRVVVKNEKNKRKTLSNHFFFTVRRN